MKRDLPGPAVAAQRLRRKNPFAFGTELAPKHLVDREDAVDLVVRTGVNGGRLFLLGPRRYGKTSVLAAAEAQLRGDGIAVLRYDAERYETIGRLAETLLAGAARELTGTLEKAGEAVTRLFGRFSPRVEYDFVTHRISVGLGVATELPSKSLPVLTEVLDAINRMAREAKREAVVILDEFQQMIAEGGEMAERQIRSVVQQHHHVAYIFAGSKTRMLIDMTNSPGRAFWKLGARYVLGPIPRPDFLTFLTHGFTAAGFAVEAEALVHLVDLAEDVPYNVQQLAHAAWELLRVERTPRLTRAFVDRALAHVVAQEDAPYTQLWTSLTRTQKIVLRAVIADDGRQLRSAETLARYGIASSTMTRTLRALDDRGVIREEEHDGAVRYRLEDPFLAPWLALGQQT